MSFMETLFNTIKQALDTKLSKSDALNLFMKKDEKISWDKIENAPNVSTLVVQISYSYEYGAWVADKTYDEIRRAYPNVMAIALFGDGTGISTPRWISGINNSRAFFSANTITKVTDDKSFYSYTEYSILSEDNSVERKEYYHYFDTNDSSTMLNMMEDDI